MSLTKVTWPAEIEAGRLQVPDEDGFKQAIACLAGRVLITIEYVKGKRSARQNRYLWGVCYKLIAEYTGHSPEEIHEICKLKFNLKKIDLPNEEHYEIGGTTTDMDIDEFSRYTEEIRRWAADDLSVVIPEPGQTDWL